MQADQDRIFSTGAFQMGFLTLRCVVQEIQLLLTKGERASPVDILLVSFYFILINWDGLYFWQLLKIIYMTINTLLFPSFVCKFRFYKHLPRWEVRCLQRKGTWSKCPFTSSPSSSYRGFGYRP